MKATKTTPKIIRFFSHLNPVLVAAFFATTAASSHAQTLPCVETNGVKFLMPPNTASGLDVLDQDTNTLSGIVLADDFFCNTPGPITDIHFWGSWLSNIHGTITNIWIGIYDDVPGFTNFSTGQVTPSHPGTNLLWHQIFGPGEYAESAAGTGTEGFFDPAVNALIGGDNQAYYYCVYPTNPFVQVGTVAVPTNYWLAIYTKVAGGNPGTYGWKTSISNYNDGAVWGMVQPSTGLPIGNWLTMTNPQTLKQIDLSFMLNTPTNPPVQTPCVETNGLKYVQVPDLLSGQGADVWNCSTFPPGVTDGPWWLADDFICTNTGSITDIHLWGSWQNDSPSLNTITFQLYMLDNIPATAGSAPVPSHPGTNVLWHQTFTPGSYAETIWYDHAAEYFMDPGTGAILGSDSEVWYYCFNPTNLNQYGTRAAPQTNWLVVFAELPAGVGNQVFGWKTTTNVQNDISAHLKWTGYGSSPLSGTGWVPNYEFGVGQRAVDLAFKLNTATNPPVQTPCVETNGVKYVQGPDLYSGQGADVWNCDIFPPGVTDGPWWLGDDFICTTTGPITDIHLWGSWQNDAPLLNTITFQLYMLNNVPATTGPTTIPSHPGTNILWHQTFTPGTYAETIWANNASEYFMDPGTGAVLGGDSVVWYYCFNPTNLNQYGTAAAPQTNWLVAFAELPATAGNHVFGWKTTTNVQNDISAHLQWTGFGSSPISVGGWAPTYEFGTGQRAVDLAFKLTTPTNTPPPPTQCVETNGVKYLQPPNVDSGLDVWNNPYVLADDFVCTNSGPISDIHIWGSWLSNQVAQGTITFWLGIYDDVQPSATNSTPFSHPGTLLWQQWFAPGQYAENPYATGSEQFLDPGLPAIIGTDNEAWYYCFYPTNPLVQLGSTAMPKTYWLAAYAQLPSGGTNQYGWKTTQIVRNDVSVHAPWPGVPPVGNPGWMPTLTPPPPAGGQGTPLDLAFKITTQTNRCPVPIICPTDMTVECGSAWSFGSPNIGPDPCCPNAPTETYTTVTNILNPCQTLITRTWYIYDCVGFVGICAQNVLVEDTNALIMSGCLTNQTFECPTVPSFVQPVAKYVCSGSNATVGVLSYTVVNLSACLSSNTVVFSATNQCSGVVSYCTETALVFDTNAPIFSGCVTNKTVPCGSSWAFDTPTASYLCTGSNAVVGVTGYTNFSLGPCTSVQRQTWSATNVCSGAIATCTETVTIVATNPPIMTCHPNKTVTNGTAWTFDPPTATDACSGSNVTVTVVGTTTNGTGPCNQTYTRTWKATDVCSNTAFCSQTVTNVCPPVVCVESDYEKYLRVPNISGGYDVWNVPYVLADDFVCTNTGPISDIHLWGSWLNDRAQTNSITFWLGIYDDVPVGSGNPYSHPSTNLLWQQWFAPGQYAETIWTANATESFLDPGNSNILGTDAVVWYYCFYPTNAFQQLGTPTNSKTYWLAAYAQLPSGVTNQYGWKTTTNVLNDTSVHAFWPGYAPANTNPGWKPTAWQPPTGGPAVGLDLSLKLTMCGPLKIRYLTPTNIVLTWPGSAILQVSTATNLLHTTDVAGPYVDVVGATSPYTTNTTIPAKFYRLRCY